jgi:hypothetical protein
MHEGWNSDRQVFGNDIELLAHAGLINVQQRSSSEAFYVTPLGFEYYQTLIGRQAEPLARVQERVTSSLSGTWFSSRYPAAYKKWSEAEALLTDDASDSTASVIGHLTREAMQEFADAVVRRLEVNGAPPEKEKIVVRIRAAIAARKPSLNTAAAEALEALLTYWVRLNPLIQRQEHGALKEGQRLTWVDSRRVVFLLAVVFYELDAALE